MTSKRANTLTPQAPHNIANIAEVCEVFPETVNAIRAIVARLDNGQYAVWSALATTLTPCTSAVICTSEDEALVEYARLISDLLMYSYPEAVA